MQYSRDLPAGVSARTEAETEQHVRHHLSSVCHHADDGEAYAHEVTVDRTPLDGGGLRLTGTIDREPVADYLRDDFDPESDVARNPLSVPSIDEPCPCGGRRWTDDENWEPEHPREWDGKRRQGDGLIPCGFCNEGGWNVEEWER